MARESGAEPIFNLRKRQSRFGQIILAENNYISAVALKLHLVGRGGNGNFKIQLKKASRDNNDFKVSDIALSETKFSPSSDLERFKIGKDIYKFPLPAFVEKDQYYFIEFNNQEVSESWFNYIQAMGFSDDKNKYQKGAALAGDLAGELKKIGGLCFQLYGGEYTVFDDKRLLSGSAIEKIDVNTGKYHYQKTGDAIDYLNIDSINNQPFSDGAVFYQSEDNSIVGRAENNNNFIYAINTVYPFSQMRFEFEGLSEQFFPTLVYYSFDQINWQKLKRDPTFESTKSYDQVIAGNGGNLIYFKITYDLFHQKAEKNLFGVKNMRVTAELRIK